MDRGLDDRGSKVVTAQGWREVEDPAVQRSCHRKPIPFRHLCPFGGSAPAGCSERFHRAEPGVLPGGLPMAADKEVTLRGALVSQFWPTRSPG